MPYHVGEDASCPADEPYAVIKDADGSVEGCHVTESDAQDQVKALYAAEPQTASSRRPVEYRTFQLEVRSAERGIIDGYAAVYDKPSEEMGFMFGSFKERIARGTFDGVLKDDTRALVNHDYNYVLGRAKSGTLQLSTDERGLRAQITPPDTQWARDLMVSMKRGDIDQMSFGFSVDEDGAHIDEKDGMRVRTSPAFSSSWVNFLALSIRVRNS